MNLHPLFGVIDLCILYLKLLWPPIGLTITLLMTVFGRPGEADEVTGVSRIKVEG